MKLVKKLEMRDFGKYKARVGLFYCPACSGEVEKTISHGKRDKTCGCVNPNITHGDTGKRLYKIWGNMRGRCYDKNNIGYHRYGGRGITVCKLWYDYIEFRKWALSNGYNKNLQIDRIDNDGDYESVNCRWVTPAINTRNSSLVKLTQSDVDEIRGIYKTGFYTQENVAKKYSVSRTLISFIVNYKRWR